MQNFSTIIKKINYKKLLGYLFVSILFFGVLFNTQYAIDTYVDFTEDMATHFMALGRFMTAICIKLVRHFNLKEVAVYRISYIFSIIFLTISLYEIDKIIKDEVENKVKYCITLVATISILIIINTYIIALIMYLENSIMMLSILCEILAAKHFIKLLKRNKLKEIIWVVVYMLVADGCYAGTVGLFIALILPFIIKYSKNIYKFLANNLIAIFSYGIPALIDLVIAKLNSGERIVGEHNLTESIKKIWSSTDWMFKGMEIIPEYIFGGTIILLIIISIIEIIINKNRTLKSSFSLIYIILGVYIVTIAPFIVQTTDSINIVPRVCYPIATIQGILILNIFMNIQSNRCKTNIIEYVILFMGLFLILSNLINFSTIIVSRYKTNEADKQISKKIVERINEYEETTQTKIEKICVYYDKNRQYNYLGIKSPYKINEKALHNEVILVATISYYSGNGRRYSWNMNQNEDIKQKFEGKNWDAFSEEQLIFDKDTLHICVY